MSRRVTLLLVLVTIIFSFAAALSVKSSDINMRTRRGMLQVGASIAAAVLLGPQVVNSLSLPSGDSLSEQTFPQSPTLSDVVNGATKPAIAYRPLSLDIPEFRVSVPVAMWFRTEETNPTSEVGLGQRNELRYNHRISVKKIGELLAGWDFIPDFAAKDFQLQPAIGDVVDGTKMAMPTRGPVVFLAHGYLGSRFDLSHIAEALAHEGESMLDRIGNVLF